MEQDDAIISEKTWERGEASTSLNRMSLFHHEFILLLSFTIQYLLVGIIQIYLPKLLQVSNQSIGSRWLTKLKYIPLESIIWGRLVGTPKMDGSSSEKKMQFFGSYFVSRFFWPHFIDQIPKPRLMRWWASSPELKSLNVWPIWNPLDPSVTIHLGLSENSVPHCTQWFCWSLSLLNGYFIGNINPTFSDKPISETIRQDANLAVPQPGQEHVKDLPYCTYGWSIKHDIKNIGVGIKKSMVKPGSASRV